MEFEILDVDALGRIGKIKLNNKTLKTPNLFPVVHPYKNIINPSELKKMGFQCIFTNAYILFNNEHFKTIALQKGLHKFLNFDGLIATDSGAFQQYMYSNNNIEITPEEIESFQESIGSDFPVILDSPVQPDDDYITAKNKVNLTIKRAKENIQRRKNLNCAWFGPIHGSRYFELLKFSANIINNLDFDVYAIGGLVKSFLKYRFELCTKILLTVKKILNPSKPIHMFGLGLPQYFSLAVASGCDLMDSAAYILYAKEKRYFTLTTGTKNINELEEFPCHCPICTKYTPKELRNFEDSLMVKLIAQHNLYLSFSELKLIRQSIKEGNLWELVEQRVRAHPYLVNALKIRKKNIDFFEKHEKIYKKTGRLFSSVESLSRPLIARYIKKLIKYYRIPPEVKYIIILPELDAKKEDSPAIKEWLNLINLNKFIPRREIGILFTSNFFGIIPLELCDTYPQGQFESVYDLENRIYVDHIIKILRLFIELKCSNISKFAILSPIEYKNQYNEKIKFPLNHPTKKIYEYLKPKLKEKIIWVKNIEDALKFFKNDVK
ncbi:MAG: tRNA guanosine(15) transglycosylase TgtA [Promethearchaeota archaeon]